MTYTCRRCHYVKAIKYVYNLDAHPRGEWKYYCIRLDKTMNESDLDRETCEQYKKYDPLDTEEKFRRW